MVAHYFNVFALIVKLEMQIFKKQIISKAIDSVIWVFAQISIISYLGPHLGLSPDFIKINMIGTIGTIIGLGEMYPNFINLLTDITGDRIISYYTTLPVPYWIVFLAKIVNYSIISLVMVVFTVPLIKFLLPGLFIISGIGLLKLLTLSVLATLLFGSFAFMLASFTKNIFQVGTVWMRVIFPIWFFGGFQFTWAVLYSVLPWAAMLNLLNPFTYITEGLRSTFSQPTEIPFWLCMVAMVIMTIVCMIVGFKKMKKRLDCV